MKKLTPQHKASRFVTGESQHYLVQCERLRNYDRTHPVNDKLLAVTVAKRDRPNAGVNPQLYLHRKFPQERKIVC